MTNLELAPPPKLVDGLLAVPVDITSVDASFVFDGLTQSATADATMTYSVGPDAGNPIFDLRQTIAQAWLDGTSIPPVQLAHHTFGSGPFTDLRVVESVQAAGSVHTLRVQYPLAMPNSQLGGSYLPALDWLPGPRLRFVFGLSDLNRARYAESWLPANLLFDQFSIDLDIQLVGTLAAHSVLTSGVLTNAGSNHWQIAFPGRSSALSPMLEVRATDTLEQLAGSVTLPVSGKTVPIAAWKPLGATTNLAQQITNVHNLLAANENDYGACLHDRFVAFFNGGGGMEYEGGTTTSTGALAHEVFHSWYGRGIKPASQADGWWDEGFTRFHDNGANTVVPFDYTDPPVLLCSRDPWQRHTPSNSYSDGSACFAGLASLLGVTTLNTLMGDLYDEHKGSTPVSTARIEEYLLSRSGNSQVVGAFHRFVYGLGDPAPAPDLWLKDDVADPGADTWGTPFWDSPDLWIRNADDGGTVHQAPESGQDNWFHARVRNKAGAGTASHFVVAFNAKGYAGTEFVYPADFLPSISATAAFDLGPGQSRIVKARWPRALVPPAGAYTCLLAAIISRSDAPAAGRHVWEHNNLAQKNVIVVDLLPDTFIIVPIVLANWSGALESRFELQTLAPRGGSGLDVTLIHVSKGFFSLADQEAEPFRVDSPGRGLGTSTIELDCGGRVEARDTDGAFLTSDRPDLIAQRFPDSWQVTLPADRAGMAVDIEPLSQAVVGLKVAVPRAAQPGRTMKLHFVQRQAQSEQVVGGVAVEVHVKRPDRGPDPVGPAPAPLIEGDSHAQ